MPRNDRRSHRFIASVSSAIVLAQCSSSATTRANKGTDSSTTTPKSVVAGTPIPPDTVLRIGDQSNYLKTHLALAGQDKNLPYELHYADFDGGPPMLLA